MDIKVDNRFSKVILNNFNSGSFIILYCTSCANSY